jgi:Spy/CpxP family protein refolding chaperone
MPDRVSSGKMRNVFAAAILSACSIFTFSAEAPASASSSIPPVTTSAPKITDEQRAKARESNEKFRNEQSALFEKLRTARREMEQAAQADVTDESTIRAKAATLGQIEGELAILRARHYKELRAILPHDQAASQSGLSSGSNQYTQRLQNIIRRTNNPAIKPRPASKE